MIILFFTNNSTGISGGIGTEDLYSYSLSNALDNNYRYFPMDWVPRWMNPYYDTSSTLRNFYFLGLHYPNSQMAEKVGNVVPGFYRPISMDRKGWVAKYSFPKTYIPHIVSYTNGTSSVVESKDTEGSLHYETISPCYTIKNNILVLKNLGVRSFLVTSGSGSLDLSVLSSSPPLEDTVFTLRNSWGDLFFFELNDQRYNASSQTFNLGYDGYFTLYYTVKSVAQRYDEGLNYITIDGQRISLKKYDFRNTWDEGAFLRSFNRRIDEPNTSIKAKCQALAISRKLEDRISATLGQTFLFMWGMESNLSVTASGDENVSFLNLDKYIYIDESPYKDGNYYLLSYKPTGFVQLILNGNKIEAENYVVSGSYIISTAPLLINSKQGDLRVRYKSDIYTYTQGASVVISNGYKTPAMGMISRKVRINNVSRRVKLFKWNSEVGKLNGEAIWDF